MEWQPIETAPKDGTWVLGFFPYYGVNQMQWHDGNRKLEHHWMLFGRLTPTDPTHWMPLPEPPKEDV
jgi:hypothetical protein